MLFHSSLVSIETTNEIKCSQGCYEIKNSTVMVANVISVFIKSVHCFSVEWCDFA